MPSTTIAEVAKRAGVSPATVSYVLSGNRTISQGTQLRVRRAIEELDYKPHAGARSLRAGKTDMVALVVPFYDWSSEPVLMPFVYGVVQAARQHGWNVVLVTSDGGSDVNSVVRGKMVDGVVLMEVRVGRRAPGGRPAIGGPVRRYWHAPGAGQYPLCRPGF